MRRRVINFVVDFSAAVVVAGVLVIGAIIMIVVVLLDIMDRWP